jgi:uncharacterized glyoxalase superfamily protein PhnB
MIKVSILCMWVHDQDEAVAFYRDKLGFDVRTDVTMEGFRWVTVSPAGQSELEISLIQPDQSPMAPEMVEKVRGVMAAGAMAGAILHTDDCRRAYEELSAKGVEFTEEPNERFYGVDAGFRDPSGNGWRLVQPADVPVG